MSGFSSSSFSFHTRLTQGARYRSTVDNDDDADPSDDDKSFNHDDFYIGPATVSSRSYLTNSHSVHKNYEGLEDEVCYDEKIDDNDSRSVQSADQMSDEDIAVDLGERLDTAMPFNDGSIALGTIRLFEQDENGETRKYIRGPDTQELYPNILITTGLGKKWLRLDGLSIGTKSGITSVRVYVLPEDIDRSNRGNVKDFRKMVKYLLRFTDCTTAAWTGKIDPTTSIQCYQEPTEEKLESLFYVFNTLKSPAPGLSKYNGDMPGLQAMNDALEDNILGIKTQLYAYQKRSVAAMIKREADPAKIRDLRKNKFRDMYGNVFYLDVKSGSLLRHRLLYNEPKGGILAETMGYGKTLICLALIMATRGHYPSVPSYCIESAVEKQYEKTSSLLSMAARRLKYEGLPWKSEFYNLKKAGFHYDRCIQELQLYERSYNESLAGTLNPSRRGKTEHVNTVHLCSATLIIVPPNLIIQWRQEIEQHIDADAIDLLVVDTTDTVVPPWKELVKYDIVLISKARFEQEYRDDDLNLGRGVRYADKYKSPLTEVRWLRVICDEGHGFAGSSTKTNAMAMLDKMFIERRWVVSGTPSSTLHGVEVSLASASTDDVDLGLSRRDSFDTELEKRLSPQARDAEDKDLDRLRLIVVNFLKLQPWSNKKGDDQADFKSYLGPRVNANGERSGRRALREVMQTLIIRHRIQEIDCDLALPPLHNTITYLEPSHYDALSINLFVMILATNYVTSEREDEDYMFHPRSRGTLTTLINNLGHATFYWVGHTHQNVKDTRDNAIRYFEKNLDNVTDEDGILLTEASLVAERALEDPGWSAFSTMHEMGTYVTAFPENSKANWALDGLKEEPLLMGTTQLREVQRYVQSFCEKGSTNPLRSLNQHGNKIMTAARSRAEEESKRRDKQKTKPDMSDAGTIEALKRAPLTSSSPAKRNQTKLPVYTKQAAGDQENLDSQFLETNLPDTQIIGFASAKLTYLCDKLLSHSEEKTIIFYNHNNTAFFIAEALELLGIQFLIYANTLSVRQRAEYLAKFNSDSSTKVLLMDLKQAGQGLHVAAASRVYIVSPIWDPALESQAIKRAHRIGQTKEVFVETLVLKDTFEEMLVKRRKEKVGESWKTHSEEDRMAKSNGANENLETLKKGKGPATNPMLEDKVMVQVLKNIKFLRLKESKEKMVRLAKPIPVFRKSQASLIDAGTQSPPTTAVVKTTTHNTLAVDKPEMPDLQDNHPGSSIFGSRASNDQYSGKRKQDGGESVAESTRFLALKRLKS